MNELSVTSRVTADGGTPVSCSSRVTVSMRASSSRLRIDRFTDTPIMWPASRHDFRWRNAIVEHELGERPDQARRLGQRDELVRRHEALRRVVPAAQRLGADGVAGREVDDRLELDPQLVALDGGAELGDEAEALPGVPVVGGVVDGDAAAPRLGRVHGDVGPLEQRRRVVAVERRGGDADAGADVDEEARRATNGSASVASIDWAAATRRRGGRRRAG